MRPKVEILVQHFAGPIRSFGGPRLVVSRADFLGGFTGDLPQMAAGAVGVRADARR